MKLARAAICLIPLFFLGAAANGARAQAAPPSTAQAATMARNLPALLQQAEGLIKNAKPAEAYQLLEPQEANYSGELAFDYMLGIVALDSGKPDRATIAFERVLDVNPNFTGARLDLARAYFAMGSDDLAKYELQIVLSQNPPAQAAGVANSYLAAIAERQLSRIQRLTGYVEAGIGSDTNVTAVTSDFSGGVQNAYGIAGVLPTGSSVHRSGSSASLAAGMDFNRLVDEQNGISLFAGIDLRQKNYNISAMNSETLILRGGAGLARGDDSFHLFLSREQFRQAGLNQGIDGDRDAMAVGADWNRKSGERDQLMLAMQLSKPRYATQPTQDSDQILVSASLLHVFEGSGSPLIFAQVSRSVDHAERALANGSDIGRTTTGLRLYFQLTPWTNTDLFLSGGVSRRRDDSANARSALIPAVYGRDLTKDLSLGFLWRPLPKWAIKGQVMTFRNDSNLDLYQYRRTETTLSLRYDF